jgi:hypothetical protein
MWINDDVDIPEALLAAQRDGRLVIFAGAGVSMGPPSNVPGFSRLATQIGVPTVRCVAVGRGAFN